MKKSAFTSVYIILLFFFWQGMAFSQGGTTIFSTNKGGISIIEGGTFTYCITDPVDKIYNLVPDNKVFAGPGITDLGGIGEANFNPAGAGVGTHTITYFSKNYTFVVTSPGAPSLAAFPEYCSSAGVFTLTGGLPVDPTGIYYVEGVAATTFNPSVRGPGIYSVYYQVGTGTCIGSSPIRTIKVNAIPVLTFVQPPTPLCADATPIDLASLVSPSGGIFSGPGVVPGNKFDPTTVIGLPRVCIVRYTYTDPITLCTNFIERNIVVNPVPVLNLVGLDLTNCEYDSDFPFTYSPVSGVGGSAVITGNGVTDLGGGTARFSPSTAGLGYHDVTFTYTTAAGCSKTQIVKVRVGTDIKITGLSTDFCQGDPIVNFNYSHWDTDPLTPPALPHSITINGGLGIIDHGTGTAEFNPSIGPSSYTVTYRFTDDLTCLNEINQAVQVLPVPTANFSGLNASYCQSSADVTLTGMPPNGSFTGPGTSIFNLGGGSATFKPSSLASGGPYNITYTVSNTSGCTDSETKSVLINPLPSVFTVSGSGSYCQGTAGISVALFDSDAGVNYQLYKNGLADGSVAGTGAGLVWANKTAGTYTVTASVAATGCSIIMNGSAVILELPEATITTQPVNVSVCETSTASFSIEASGVDLHYQWYKNGVAVGSDNKVLILNLVPLTDNGHIVYCDVTSWCGGTNKSNDVTLTVNPATVITANPFNEVRCTGGGVVFNVAASGITNTFKWKKGAAYLADIVGKISGSTSSSLVLSGLVAADAGLYSCEVSGGCGPVVTSTQGTLTVNDPIVITTQPVSIIACAGDNVSFNTASTPASGLTYQWYFDPAGAPVAFGVIGAAGQSLPLTAIAPANRGDYYCRITNACGEVRMTNTVSLDIPAPTLITVPPAGDVVCAGSNFNTSVTATGAGLTYQWYRDANPAALTDNAVIHNSNTANLSFTGLTTAYTGNYRVKVTGACGELISSPDAVISVRQPIVITSQPASITICSGSDVTFSVVATGDDLLYQWQYNNVNIGGANSADYTITGATAANAGNYRCIVSSSECGFQNSSAATLTVNPLTVITAHPVSPKNACAGTNVSFSVTAAGTGLTYQWFKDGVSMGVPYTASTLNLVGVNAASAGSYTCQVTGTCGPAPISTPGVLTIDIPAVVAIHPVSASVCLGSIHELNVVLSAGTNPAYQWYFDPELDGTFVSLGAGATSQILSINPFNAAAAGDYYCRITNGCGFVNSQVARLSLIDVFNITVPLADFGVCQNSNKTLTVAADQPVSYEWRKNGIVIPGQTASSLILNNIPFADNGAIYSCRIYNNCMTRITSATLTVETPVSITQQPLDGIACPAAPYSTVVVASGTNLTYQWYKAPAALLPGKIGSALSFAAFAAGDAGTYYCIVANDCGSVQTSNAVITAGTNTTVTNPAALQLCTGNDAVFTVTATGQNLVYEWRKNYIPLVDDGRITGSNTNNLSIKNIVAADEETYDIIVTGTCGLPVTSSGAFLEATTPPSIITNPVPQTICSGGNASFSVTVTPVVSDPPPTYQWQIGGVPIIGNPSATTSTLSLPAAVAGGIYNCIVTNTCGSVTSTSAELIIEQNINIVSHPAPLQTNCEGSNVSFTASITGPTDMTLQWYKDDGTPTGLALVNGGRISGVNLPTLTINNVAAADAGSYFCRATGMCGVSVTNSGTLVIQSRIAVTHQPQSITVCPGEILTLSTIATGTITNYQWRYFNGVATVDVGTNSPVYSVSPFAAATHAGTYTCQMTNICETVISDAAFVTGGIATTATISADITQCEGANATFTVASSGSGLTYKWYHGAVLLSDNARIGGSSSATLNISGLVAGDAGTYQCEVSGSCGFDNDNAAVLTVNRNINFDVQPVSTSALIGTTGTFTVVASGSITGYQWYKGATLLTDIAGETSGTGTATLSVLNAQPVLDEGSYSCVVSGICGNRTSNSATLTVIPASAITVQPVTPVNVCQGLPISISITTSGAGHTYEWRRDGTAIVNGGRISGATSASLTIAASLAGDAGAYTCLVDGSEISAASIVTINPSTAITTHPSGGTKCAGDVHIFSVTATGAGLTYQWYKNDLSSPIGGALSSDYTINPVSVADNGSYFCVVNGTCGPQISNPATLVVNNPVTIFAQPLAPPTICEGSSTSLTFGVSGSGLSYVWKKNGQPITEPNVAGITTATLVISNSTTANAGVYSCSVTGLCSTLVTSDNATITVNPTTSLTLQPVGRNTCEGDAVTFTVSATGTNLIYDWRRNGFTLGIAAPGSPTLTISGLTKAAHEGTYTCVVTGTCGAPVTSDPAVLAVNRLTSIGAPVISVNPICQGASTRITIAAAGDGLTYLWKKGGQPVTSASITGINTNELVISNAQVADAGVYTCSVSGLCGSPLTSTNAVITVHPTTVITTQPFNYTKCAGDEVIFDVVASGDITAYQWLKGAIPLVDGVQPSGAVVTGSGTSQLRITNLTTAEVASYTSSITGTCGIVSTTPAVLVVNVPAQITVEPPALTQICQGSSTSLTVTTTGTITSFKWKKDGNYVANGGSYSGVNSGSLVISNALLSDAGFYSCEITSNCNSLNTIGAELRINPLTAITLQPAGGTLCEGENVQFMVNATGGLPLTYQWRFNNVAIPGATNNTFIINGINGTNAGAYTCLITSASGCGTATSNPANLVVNSGAKIITQPVNTTVCQGSTAIISVAASGTAPVTYRWKYNNVDIIDGGRISGSTTNELRISGSADADEGIYKCIVTSPCGNVESSSVTLTVDAATNITIQPANQNILQGTTAVFSVASNGVIISYQWQKDGSNLIDDGVKITGATTAILMVANVVVADAGSYRCVVTGKCGTLTSNPGILTVNVPVTITASPADVDRCTGGSASFNIVATGSIVNYRWMLNGVNLAEGGRIQGSTTPNLVISSVTASDEGNYSCTVTGTFNIANSSIAELTVNEPTLITVQPLTQALCLHDWLVLEVNATGENLSYAWEKDGAPLVADANTTGINTSLLVITDVTAARSGSYRCRVWNSCNTEMSNVAVITINPALTLVTSPASDTKCEGQNTSFSALATGANLHYQWYKGGVLLGNSVRVTGAGTANLTISSLETSDQDSYYCTITDDCNTISSAAASLIVKERVVILQQPQNMPVCEGQNAFFEVRATGSNLIYKWQKDGSDIIEAPGHITGTTSSVLVITNAVFGDRGVYRCLVTGDCNSILSNTASLTVNLRPVAAGAIMGSGLICQGATRVLYVVPAIANATSYVWSLPHGAIMVGGNGTRSIEVDYPVGSVSGTVSVYGINGCADGASSSLPVTVNPLPLAAAGPDQILCTDATTLAADATGYIPGTGIWTKISGQGNIASPAVPNSAITGVGQGDNVFRWTVSVGGCTSSDDVKITNRKVFVDAGADQIICSMSTTLAANIPSSGIGSWSIVSGGGVFSNMADPKASVINLTRGANTFLWSINNGGCVSSDEIIVRNDLPTNSDAGVDAILLVDNYTLAANVPVIGTGRWTLINGSATITNPNLFNTMVTGLGIGDNVFRWTITHNLCYSQDEVKVTNFTPTLTDAGPNQTLCSDRTSLAGTKPNYGTGQWSVVAGSGTFTDPYKWDTEVFNMGKGTNIYKWTVYEYMVTSDEVTIINNSPSSANAGIDQRLCITTSTLAANNPMIGTGAWSVIGGSGSVDNTALFNSVVRNLGSGSNTLRWTVTNGGCSSYDEVNIINDQPTFAEAGGDQVICADSVALYPNTPTIGNGEWSVVSGSAFFRGNKAYNLARGENRFAWTITNNTCTHTDIVSITSNKPTAAYTGADKSICVDNITLPGNTPTYGTGVWTILSGSGNIQNANFATSQVTNLAPGSNRFRWTITYNGCVSFDEVAISYDFIPANAGTDQVICLPGAILNATDAGIGTGQWSVVGGSGSANFTNPNQSNTEVNSLDRGMNMLRWTVTNAGCVSSDDVVITNNSPSNAYAGSDRSVCGEEILLNANTPLVGTAEWSILGGSAIIASPTASNSRVSNLSIGRNVLRWTVTHLGCVSYDEVVINNDQPTNIEAGPSQYICSDSTQLYATAPVVGYGRWSIIKGSAVFVDNTLYNTRITNLGKGENQLIWTVTSAGCSNHDSVTVVNNLPSAPNAGPDLDVCSDNVFMSANLPSIGTGKWSVVSGSATFASQGTPNSKATLLGNGPNVLRWTISNGSCTMFDEVTVLNSLPTVAYAGEDRSVCNSTANLLATNPAIGRGTWSLVSGSGFLSDTAAYNSQIANLGFGQNTLRWTTELGRCSTSDDVIITNNLAEVYAGPDQVVYQTTARLIGNKPMKGTGQWVVLAGIGVVKNASGFETSVTGLGGGANSFAWTINNEGCIASDQVVVTHRVMPVADFEPLPGSGCPPLHVSFVNTSVGGAPYRWDFGDGTTSTASNTNHTYNIPGTYKVRLTATGPDGFLVHKDTIVIVRPIPVASFEITPDTAFIPGNAIHFFNLSQDIDSLKWEFGDGNTSNEENPSYKYTEKGSYDVTLHVWSGDECYDALTVEDAVLVDLAGVINCPNAFTPNLTGPSGGNYNNNDFSNDIFHCYIDGAATYHMEVYNRLGIRMFETDDINIGWDGYFKGKLVEEGAYVFRAVGKFNNGQQFNFFGNILVIY